METTQETTYSLSYWVNREQQIALVRVTDTKVQGWKSFGRDLAGEFEHSHFQTIYPSKERLDEYLQKFEPSNLDEYLTYQFAQHQLDDHFREKANAIRNKLVKQ